MKNKKVLISIILIGAIALFIGINLYSISNELKNNGVYTVGEVTGIRNGPKSAKNLKYKYIVKGKIYKGEYGKLGNAKIGHKYLVLYSEKKVFLNVIYTDKPMDSIELGTQVGSYNDLQLPINTWAMPYWWNSPAD